LFVFFFTLYCCVLPFVMNKDYQMQFSAQNKLDIVRQTQFLTGRRQGRLNQWAHWARAQGPGYFSFLFEGPQLAVVK